MQYIKTHHKRFPWHIYKKVTPSYHPDLELIDTWCNAPHFPVYNGVHHYDVLLDTFPLQDFVCRNCLKAYAKEHPEPF
jgi:hypothetical protein